MVFDKQKADFSAIAEKFGITPITAKLIRNRDITEDADIERFLMAASRI